MITLFQNHGYLGLKAGIDAKAIHKKKGLKKTGKYWIIWEAPNWQPTF